MSFSVSPRWLKLLTEFKQKDKVGMEYFDTENAGDEKDGDVCARI